MVTTTKAENLSRISLAAPPGAMLTPKATAALDCIYQIAAENRDFTTEEAKLIASQVKAVLDESAYHLRGLTKSRRLFAFLHKEIKSYIKLHSHNLKEVSE
jgi:hypothetical protein